MIAPDARSRAEILYEARATQQPVAPFTDDDPTLGAAGYAVQRELTALLLADGDSVVGYKAGLTSAPMQEMFGVDTPTSPRCSAPPSTRTAPSSTAQVHRAQGGGGDRVPAGVAADRARCRRRAGACRHRWGRGRAGDRRLPDRGLAHPPGRHDRRSRLQRAAVLGSWVEATAGTDYRRVGVTFRCNGEVVASGTGAAALGDPVAVVAWLANVFGEHGITLEAGHLVMTGALHAASCWSTATPAPPSSTGSARSPSTRDRPSHRMRRGDSPMKRTGGLSAAVLGAGLIGVDLADKIMHSDVLDLGLVVGRDGANAGLRQAARLGMPIADRASPRSSRWTSPSTSSSTPPTPSRMPSTPNGSRPSTRCWST